MRRLPALTALISCLLLAPRSHAGFDLQFAINDPTEMFTAEELTILNDALLRVERMWETVITGYQPGVAIPAVSISIHPSVSGLASANHSSTTIQGGFVLTTSGFININVHEIENFADWQGPGANGRNYIDELLAHEAGHALGIGTLWDDNSMYVNGSFQYTGAHGLAAYQAEFDPLASWVPVENAGSPGTPNAHWDQLMRSSQQEGNPNDPWSLDPRVGVVDSYGRDRGLELMTGAIDPDFGEPFVSRFGVEAMRDLGYAVAAFEDFNSDGLVDLADLDVWKANYGAAGLQVDSMAFGDANRDRQVDGSDFVLWQRAYLAAGGAIVPEPSALALAVVSGVAAVYLTGARGSSVRRPRLP